MSADEMNPFEVLRMDPATPAEGVVQAAAQLRQRAPDDAAVAAIRRAVQSLTGSREDRRLHELLTHAAPCYSWPAIEQFVALHWRVPNPQI